MEDLLTLEVRPLLIKSKAFYSEKTNAISETKTLELSNVRKGSGEQLLSPVAFVVEWMQKCS